ncbi:MAG: translation elongation factor-like protein [Candidatus Thorarchaeota archaeon]|nr:MAG: translation elongation factor-like protein [Candidatus Thorarchaeota archaeon]
MSDKKLVGVVTRYFAKIGVAAIMLEDTLKVGSKISVEGTTTNFEQNVASMQIDRADIQVGEAGQEIAIKVSDRVREKDKVYLLD